MSALLARFRDPVSGLTHLAGAFIGIFGLIYLVGRPQSAGTALVAFAVYGLSLIGLYLSSAAYHLARVSPEALKKLRQLDHAMVPVFIAGTYTPFCLLALHGWVGETVLITVWSLAAAGLLKSLFWLHSPRWVTAGVYVVMGWVVLAAVYPLSQAVSSTTIWLIFGGGGLYSVGALIYARKWPNPWPPHFGFHELWHLFVLAGSACHYAAVLMLA